MTWTIYKGGQCNELLCPRCRDEDKGLGSEDTYVMCFYCGFSTDSLTANIVDIDWDVPKGYKKLEVAN